MIIYKKNAAEFLQDVDNNQIADLIQNAFLQQLGRYPSQEKNAWTNSMRFMETIIRKSKISCDCGILIEYNIPLTSKRIDFLIAGTDSTNNRNFVIIELKQWDYAKDTNKDGIILTFIGKREGEHLHPSYQASSYKQLLLDYNENVEKLNLGPLSCAYLHNYKKKIPEPLHAKIYSNIVNDSPLFFKNDAEKLQRFIYDRVGHGKGMQVLYDIQFGNIRPSKKLIDHICGMFKGNKEFTLIDSQKIAYEKALEIALKADSKTVLIIKGGPGTGKSVISINLLGALLKEEHNIVFVAPNAAFRDVLMKKLAQENRLNRLKILFKGSSSFVEVKQNTFDTIIVDEAHRLKNGTAYQYYGENQLEDIIKSAINIILFIDDNQRIRPEDIGTVSEIKRVATSLGAKIFEFELDAQFRCSGAEGYLNWLDNLFQIRDTANFTGWDKKDFDFRICENPNTLRDLIAEKNQLGFSARILAGYAWKWTSEEEGNINGEIDDVKIPEYNFKMPWNSRRSRTTWAIDPTGVDQVGCIHTSQGLEFDYIGVIVGYDLAFDSENATYHVDWDSYKDAAGKKNLKKNPLELCKLVRNIYKTLMSRGMKGCYVYFTDKALEKHFKNNLTNGNHYEIEESKKDIESILTAIEQTIRDDQKYTEYLPVYSFAAACGYFGAGEPADIEGWIKTNNLKKLSRNMFIVRACGKSMEPLIPEGSYCIFKAPVVGTRNGKIVLVQHHDFFDPDHGGAYSIKKYSSEKQYDHEGNWKHEQIILHPINPIFSPISIQESASESFTVIAEFIGIVPKN
jgi:uncharacterized protein